MHILMVEDEKHDYQIAKRALGKSDLACEITWVPRGEEALARLQTETFDIVLIDFKLPDLSGLETFQQIIARGLEIPVVFVSGTGNESVAVDALKLGAQDYLVKDPAGEYLKLLPTVVRKARSQWEEGQARQQAQEALRQAEERVRTFIESVDDMVYFQGLDGSLSMLNTANAKITGYTLEEFAANPQLWRDIVHPDDVKIAERFFADYPDGVPSFEIEYRLLAKSGEWRWIQSRMVGIKDADGRYLGYNCIDRDITERKRAEEARLQVNAELERRVNELSTLNRITQAVTTITDLNAVLKIVGQELRTIFKDAGIGITLLNDSRTEHKLAVHYPSNPNNQDLTGSTFPIGSAFSQYYAKGKTAVISQAQTDPLVAPYHKLLKTLQIHSILSVPLRARGEIIGAISLTRNQKDREFTADEVKLTETIAGQVAGAIEIARLFEEEQRQRQELQKRNKELEEALAEVKRLSGLLPICANCKKIRDDEGYWQDVAVYIRDRSEAEFSHGICPNCLIALYPDFYGDDKQATQPG